MCRFLQAVTLAFRNLTKEGAQCTEQLLSEGLCSGVGEVRPGDVPWPHHYYLFLLCLSNIQASVYCVAAVLWTAAKFSVPQDHKLALPRRLKTLLLDMARRHASERPSAAEAIKVTALWLGPFTVSRVGVGDSREVLAMAYDAEADNDTCHLCRQHVKDCHILYMILIQPCWDPVTTPSFPVPASQLPYQAAPDTPLSPLSETPALQFYS